MKGGTLFFLRSFSLNVICLYLEQKKAWIHCRNVLNSLCSCSCIVPFYAIKIFSSRNSAIILEGLLSLVSFLILTKNPPKNTNNCISKLGKSKVKLKVFSF